MNLEEYFQRIGFCGPFEKPDLATLTAIHKNNVMTIPFENLSIHCGEKIVLDLESIFNKIVRGCRGGWCMESNYLFAWVLKELGYDSVILGARVIIGLDGDSCAPESHLINMVTIDGKVYIADVGFGVSYQLWEPMELVSGKDHPQGAGVFRLIDQGEVWVFERTGRKPQILNPDFAQSSIVNKKQNQQIYCFSLVPREIDHFTDVNHTLQTDPMSLFTSKSISSLQTPTGFRALVGWTYSEVTFRPDEGVDLVDIRDIVDEEVETILWEKFNLKLMNKFSPKNNQMCYTL
ncbi:unnamed protein product [Merluccius merluccius]